MASFIDLRINCSRIESLLKDEGFKVNSTSQNTSSQKNIEVISENDEKFILEIYAKQQGTTTLVSRNDKNNISQQVCELIAEKLKYFDISNVNAVMVVKEADFNYILEKIKITFPNDLQEKEINGGMQYNLSASKAGSLTFKYFNKRNRLQLQGKALQHFYFIFMQLNDKGYDLLPNISEMADIKLTGPSVLLGEYMPIMKDKLPLDVKKITATSLQLLKINANFSDGFVILYPMIRTLEHLLRFILEKHSYEYGRDGFNMFGGNADGSKGLRRKSGCVMSDDCATMLGRGYTFYSKHRFSFAHMSDDVSEIRTISVEEAKELTLECIELIEEIGNDFY